MGNLEILSVNSKAIQSSLNALGVWLFVLNLPATTGRRFAKKL